MVRVRQGLWRESIAKWWSADPLSLGAALAFYTIFSLAPLLILIMSAAGSFLSPQVIEGRFVSQIQEYVGSDSAEFITSLIFQVQQPQVGIIANVISVLVLIFAATGVFSHLQLSLNKLWNVEAKKKISFITFLEEKVSALLMIIAFSFIFLASFALNALSRVSSSLLNRYVPDLDKILIYGHFIISFLIVVGMFMLIYKYLPNAPIPWRIAFEGSLITGILFIAGTTLINVYLEFVPIVSSYGAVGSLMLILLWVYYSSQVFFLGAAFTYVLDKRINKKSVLV
jgi:membrane protein